MHFGTLAYEIVSDVAGGRINAVLEMPSRKAPREVLLRLSHPKAAPIRSVAVNGKEWKDFDATRELVRLGNVPAKVTVTASY